MPAFKGKDIAKELIKDAGITDKAKKKEWIDKQLLKFADIMGKIDDLRKAYVSKQKLDKAFFPENRHIKPDNDFQDLLCGEKVDEKITYKNLFIKLKNKRRYIRRAKKGLKEILDEL